MTIIEKGQENNIHPRILSLGEDMES